VGQLFDPISLSELLIPTVPLIETFLRGTMIYLALFAMLRFMVKRGGVAGASVTDLLVLVIIADAAQNAMAANYTSITDGILLVATIIFWSYALDWLSYRFRPIRRFVFPHPRKLIENGQFLRENMERELIVEEQLRALLRVQGIEDVGEVKEARIEPNGQISVIPFNDQDKSGGTEIPGVT
jgi:uncharacterized membrane protein YcaP (DUF421 family)